MDFGNLLIGGDIITQGGAKIFDNMQKAWNASVSQGFNPSYTPVVYPFECAGTSFYAFSGWTNPFISCPVTAGTWGTGLGAIYLQQDEWQNNNEDVSYHEYGHALMHRAFSNAWYPNTGGGNHSVFPQPAGFAWSEGWATFFTQVVQNDGNYKGIDLEIQYLVPYSYYTGEINEWRVAESLIDLYDTNVDGNDNCNISFAQFISILQSNNISSLSEFWNYLKNTISPWEKYYGSSSLIYNTIPIAQEPMPIPPVISSFTQYPIPITESNDGTVTVNLSQGNGTLNYNWSYISKPSWVDLSFSNNVAYISANGLLKKEKTIFNNKLPVFTLTCIASNEYGSSTSSFCPNIVYSSAFNESVENKLEQNFPNPFNPKTSIKYNIKSDGFVTLKITNILGQEVAVLVNEFLRAGLHKADFDATFLPSGIYFYTISCGNFSEIKKMILIK